MNVTRDNFEVLLPKIRDLIGRCDFYSVDFEMTGIRIPGKEGSITDPADLAFLEKNEAAKKFAIVQFGLCLFIHQPSSGAAASGTSRYEAYPFNFYAFPARPEVDIVMNVDTLGFLSKHGMDFNKWLNEGVTYMPLTVANREREKLGSSPAGASSRVKKFEQSMLGKVDRGDNAAFTDFMAAAQTFAEATAAAADGNGPEPAPMKLPYFKNRDTLAIVDSYLASLSLWRRTDRDGPKPVTYVCSDAESGAYEQQRLESRIGLTRLYELLLASKKPIIAHNSLSDFLFMHHAFDGRGIETLADFKGFMMEKHPLVFDTRHLATLPQLPYDAKMVQNLEGQYNAFAERHATVEIVVQFATGEIVPWCEVASRVARRSLLKGKLVLYAARELGDGTLASIRSFGNCIPVYRCLETVLLEETENRILHDGAFLSFSDAQEDNDYASLSVVDPPVAKVAVTTFTYWMRHSVFNDEVLVKMLSRCETFGASHWLDIVQVAVQCELLGSVSMLLSHTRWRDFVDALGAQQRVLFDTARSPEMVKTLLNLSLSAANDYVWVYRAARDKNVDLLRALLEGGAVAHASVDPPHWSPLHAAVHADSKECVELLLPKVNINMISGDANVSPIALSQSPEMVELLLRAGADPSLGSSRLSLEVVLSDVKSPFAVVKPMLDWVDGTIRHEELTMEYLAPMLFRCCCHTTLAKVTELLSYLKTKLGSDGLPLRPAVTASDCRGQTALHRAVQHSSDPALITYLRSQGAAPQQQDDEGLTPLELGPCSSEVIAVLLDGSDLRVTELLCKRTLLAIHGPDAAKVAQYFAGREDVKAALGNLLDRDDMNLVTGTSFVHDAAIRGSVSALSVLCGSNDKTRWEVQTQSPHKAPGSVALHLAVAGGHLDCVELLLKQPLSPDCVELYTPDNSKSGLVPLPPIHQACSNGFDQIVSALIRSGADMNRKFGPKGHAPIHHAAIAGHVKCLQVLHAAGATMTTITDDGEQALAKAAEHGRVDCVMFLLRVGAELMHKRTSGATAIHLASMNGHTEIVRHLLDTGADVNNLNVHSVTPLSAACGSGHIETVKLLVERGADVQLANSSKGTPLHGACIGGHLEVAEFLVERGANPDPPDKDGWTPFHRACHNGHLGVVKFLHTKGVDFNAASNVGSTPIHLSAAGGHLEITQFLIDLGADVKKRNNLGVTPVIVACENGGFAMVKYLVDTFNANLFDVTNTNRSTLHNAALSGNVELITFLLDMGLDSWASDNNEMCPVLIAAAKGHLSAVMLLVNRGANVNQKMNNEETPLHLAAQNGHHEVASFLIERGADVNAAMRGSWKPIHKAAMQGHLETVKLLVEAGTDFVGVIESAVRLATDNKHPEVAKYLQDASATR